MDVLYFLAGWAVRSTLVVAIATLICFWGQRLSAAAKHLVWRGALASVLVTGIGMTVTRQTGVKTPTVSLLAATILSPGLSAGPPPMINAGSGKALTAIEVTAPVGSAPTPAPEAAVEEPLNWLCLIYFGGAVLMLIRWLASLVVIRRWIREAKLVTGCEDTFLARARELRVPFTLGWQRPVIVLPAEANTWSSDRWNAVILHERAHMKRNDWLWQSAAMITTAVQWFNPVVWILSSALRSTAEEAADNEVLATGMAPSIYVNELISLASPRPLAATAGTGFVRQGSLARRLRNLLSTDRDRSQANRRVALTTAAGFGLAAIGLAAYAPEPIRIPDSPTAPAQKAPGKSDKGGTLSVVYVGEALSSTRPTWMVDGGPMEIGEPKRQGFAHRSIGTTNGNIRSVVICFEVKGHKPAPFPDTGPRWNLNAPREFVARLGGIEWDGMGGAGNPFEYGETKCLRSFPLPRSWKTADLEVGLGVGKYVKAGEYSHGKGNIIVQIVPQRMHSSRPDEHGVMRTEDVTESVIKFTVPRKVEDKDWILHAYDAAGREIHLGIMFNNRRMTDTGATVWQATAENAPESFDRFILEARDHEWMRIENVHLYPG